MSNKQKPSFTVPEWCEKYDVTTPTYYEAKKRGETPDEVRIGRCVRITAEADAEWNERRTAAQREAREAREAAAREAGRAQAEAPVFTLEQAPSEPRKTLEATEEIPQLAKRTGKDRKPRTAKSRTKRAPKRTTVRDAEAV